MVCLGNICRSPIAEGILQQKANKAGLNWSVDSAGTNGFYNGESPHPLSQKVSKANGIDISNQQSRKLTKEDFKKFDIIYAMANDVLAHMKEIGGKDFDDNKVSLFLEELYPGECRNVPDPWSGKEDGYVKVYDLIDKTCEAIINKYSKK
ncbi:MAG: low molecular weight phosphotyrosine protein phosphatase [Ferruginibacter sp.]|nr:low molecular weight phosphotyrosine protein phosphatase [Ferruginibacter sp.]